MLSFDRSVEREAKRRRLLPPRAGHEPAL